MRDGLTCAVCLDLAEEAVEAQCCHHVYCEECVIELSSCPMCRKEPLEITISHLARRLIGAMEGECPHDDCDYKTTKSELKAHQQRCEYRLIQCPVCPDVELAPKLLLEHLMETHEKNILDNLSALAVTVDQIVDEKEFDTEEKEEQVRYGDPWDTQVNLGGVECTLGDSGKYYCGNLHGIPCDCCDGHCGPTNGCNCIACMKIDLDVRRIKLHEGFLVNNRGRLARHCDKTENFHCGSTFALDQGRRIHCHPEYNNQCRACSILSTQKLKYHGLWKRKANR